MADKKETEQDKQPLTFGRTLNLLNQGVESMVASTLSLPALVADGYLNIYRAGRQALGGKPFEASNLYEQSKKAIIDTGRSAEDKARTSVGMDPLNIVGPQNSTEENIVLGADIASSILIPAGLAGLATKAKTVSAVSNVARIEPTLNATTAQAAQTAAKSARIEPVLGQAGVKAAKETAETIVKKSTSHGRMSADEVAERLKAAAASGEKAGVKAADSAADGAKAAASTEQAGMKAANATDSVKAVADAEKAAAGFQGFTGWLKARAILHSPLSIGEKVNQFTRAGRTDFAEKVLLQARRNGLTQDDMLTIRKIDGAPELVKKYENLFTMQQGRGLDAKIDKISASLFGNATTTADTLAHAGMAGAKLYKDALLAPVTIAKWTYSGLRGPNAGRNIALGTAGLLGTSAMDVATDGESSLGIRSLGSKAVGAYGWFLQKNVDGGIWLGEQAYGLYDHEAAKAWAEKARQSGEKVLENLPGTIERATGVKQEQMAAVVETAGNIPGIGLVAKPLADGLKVKAGIDAARNAGTATADANRVSLAAGESGAAAKTADRPADSAAPSVRERAASAADAARVKAGDVRDKAEDAVNATLEKINIGDVLSDPQSAWKNLKKAAAGNPQLSGLIEMGDKYPGMKWGVLGGLALGMISGDGVKGKLGGAIRTALVLGLMFDALAGLMGKPSMTGQWMGQMITGNRGDHHAPATARYSRSPAPAAPASYTSSANDPLYRNGVTASVDVREQFASAKNATVPLDVPLAPPVQDRTGLNASFDRSASPAEQASPIPPERKIAANADYYAIPSNG